VHVSRTLRAWLRPVGLGSRRCAHESRITGNVTVAGIRGHQLVRYPRSAAGAHAGRPPEDKASGFSCFVDQSVRETAHLSPAEPVDAEEITDRDTMIIDSHSPPPVSARPSRRLTLISRLPPDADLGARLAFGEPARRGNLPQEAAKVGLEVGTVRAEEVRSRGRHREHSRDDIVTRAFQRLPAGNGMALGTGKSRLGEHLRLIAGCPVRQHSPAGPPDRSPGNA